MTPLVSFALVAAAATMTICICVYGYIKADKATVQTVISGLLCLALSAGSCIAYAQNRKENDNWVRANIFHVSENSAPDKETVSDISIPINTDEVSVNGENEEAEENEEVEINENVDINFDPISVNQLEGLE